MPYQYHYLITAITDKQRATPEQVQNIRLSALKKRSSFPRQLVAENLLSEQELLQLNREASNCPSADLRAMHLSTELLSKTDEATIRQYQVIPVFERGGHLLAATFDPFDSIALDALKYACQLSTVEPLLVSVSQLEQMIEDIFAGRGDIDELLNQESSLSDEQRQQELEDLSKRLMGGSEQEEAPVVRYVSEILLDAIRTGVSDLHFEPYENSYRVRFRKDGLLKEVSSPPTHIASRITARIKVMSGMDIAEKRIPQDGRIKLSVSDTRVIDFRVNTLPTLWGEKVVLRILDGNIAKLNIDTLGLSTEQQALFLSAIEKPQGLILVTGPTGSGKTVSMYAGLNILNTAEVNISTAEDPVEITLPGINQVNVNLKQGMTFATALRAFLRQDPDIIMVGEIRDLETAEIAVKAAQTGHIVMSTLHTNDAPQSITRLANMGIAPYNIAASVELIMAQRLVRCLCPHCKVRDRSWTPQQLLQLGFSQERADEARIFAPKGCEYCGDQGYKGRIGIFQVIKITPTLSEMIMSGATSLEFAEQSQREGFWDLRQAGIDKVIQGQTSIAEILRVTID